MPESPSKRPPSEHNAEWKARTIELEVWHAPASTSSPADLEEQCLEWLDDDERESVNRYKVPTSRNQHIVGRGMIRRLLSHGITHPQSIQFGFRPHGRPYVCAPKSVCCPFNVSHTNGLVIGGLVRCELPHIPSSEIGSLAVHPEDGLVGVDVEEFNRRTNLDLAERFFSSPEVDYVRSRPSEALRREAFLRIWTLKESFIKAIGTGLTTPLAQFAFFDVDTESPRIEMLDEKLESGVCWKFRSLEVRPGFIAAVAVGCVSHEDQIEVKPHAFDDWIRDHPRQ